MPRDLIKYQRALFLRKKKGYSYNEIREEVPVAKSTLSLWLRDVELSADQKERIVKNQRKKLVKAHNLGEWNRKRRQEEITKIRVRSKGEIGQLSTRELFIAGIMLYWAEGCKGNKQLRVANSDPVFISFIMQWFRDCLNITEDRFRGSIHYHQGQDYQEIERFWSAVSGIPLENFRKPFCKPPGTGHRKHYLRWGTFTIGICRGGDLLHQIMGWKDGLISDIISGKQIARP